MSLTLLIVSCDLGLNEGVAIVQDFKLLTLIAAKSSLTQNLGSGTSCLCGLWMNFYESSL